MNVAIKIIKSPDVRVTTEDLSRYQHEYARSFTHYVGPIPTLEDFIRQRKGAESRNLNRENHT